MELYGQVLNADGSEALAVTDPSAYFKRNQLIVFAGPVHDSAHQAPPFGIGDFNNWICKKVRPLKDTCAYRTGNGLFDGPAPELGHERIRLNLYSVGGKPDLAANYGGPQSSSDHLQYLQFAWGQRIERKTQRGIDDIKCKKMQDIRILPERG